MNRTKLAIAVCALAQASVFAFCDPAGSLKVILSMEVMLFLCLATFPPSARSLDGVIATITLTISGGLLLAYLPNQWLTVICLVTSCLVGRRWLAALCLPVNGWASRLLRK